MRDPVPIEKSQPQVTRRHRGHAVRSAGSRYGQLVTAGTLSATFLRDGVRPAAFRVDARAKDRLTCLK